MLRRRHTDEALVPEVEEAVWRQPEETHAEVEDVIPLHVRPRPLEGFPGAPPVRRWTPL